jgi:hypothetical protein
MFISVGLKFFESIAADLSVEFDSSHHPYFVKDQLIAFLAVEVGYGKSEKIKAFSYLAKS